jgi:hypothetical protein
MISRRTHHQTSAPAVANSGHKDLALFRAERREAHGIRTPRRLADLCIWLACVTAIVGVGIGISIGSGTSSDTTPSTVFESASAAPDRGPLAAIAITGGVLAGLSWLVVAVVLQWLAAMYESVNPLPNPDTAPAADS